MEASGQLHALAAILPGKEPLVPTASRTVPEPFWTRWWREKFPAPPAYMHIKIKELSVQWEIITWSREQSQLPKRRVYQFYARQWPTSNIMLVQMINHCHIRWEQHNNGWYQGRDSKECLMIANGTFYRWANPADWWHLLDGEMLWSACFWCTKQLAEIFSQCFILVGPVNILVKFSRHASCCRTHQCLPCIIL